MTQTRKLLSEDEALEITASLDAIRKRLQSADRLLAAVHVEHAMQCLDPENPINHQVAAVA